MWIKALDSAMWVSMKHITHFSIEQNRYRYETEKSSFTAYAYLNASRSGIYKVNQSPPAEQTRIAVCRGTEQECEDFIGVRRYLAGLLEWIGYLVAGIGGAILTLIFQNTSL